MQLVSILSTIASLVLGLCWERVLIPTLTLDLTLNMMLNLVLTLNLTLTLALKLECPKLSI